MPVRIRAVIRRSDRIKVVNKTRDEEYELDHALSERQVEVILEGSLINLLRKAHDHARASS